MLSLLQESLCWRSLANAGPLAYDFLFNGWVCVSDQVSQTLLSNSSTFQHIITLLSCLGGEYGVLETRVLCPPRKQHPEGSCGNASSGVDEYQRKERSKFPCLLPWHVYKINLCFPSSLTQENKHDSLFGLLWCRVGSKVNFVWLCCYCD